MRLISALKIFAILGILYSFVGGISEYQNQLVALEFILLFSVIWITEYYFFERNEIPRTSDFKIDLGELRKLTDTEKNRLPVRLNCLTVAHGEIPAWIVVAGGAPHSFPISFTSFQVVYDDKTVIIECPFDKVLYDKFCGYKVLGIKGNSFDEEKHAAMQRAMLKAEYIVATHEHWDHVGGIAQSPNFKEIMRKTALTSEQVHGRTIKAAGFPQGTFDEYKPLEYDQYHVLAPGIVLIKAPGHSVGSQMIFVRLRRGEEFLFIGDVGWNMVNIERLTNHSRMAMLLRHEDGKQLGHQIRWLYENIYDNQDEKIHLVTSHDPSQIEDYVRAGLIGDKFEYESARALPQNSSQGFESLARLHLK